MQTANLRRVEFPVSKKVLYIPPVSIHSIAMRVQRRYKQPSPPINLVDYGDGRKVKEFNYADPDYAVKLRGWARYIEQVSQQEALKRAYEAKLNAEQLAEVQAWKAENPDLYDEEDSDTALWIEEIAITSEADMNALIDAMGGPNEEVVEAHQDSFRSDIPGA